MNRLEELEKLVGLAENVSEKVQEIEDKISKIQLRLSVASVAAILLLLYLTGQFTVTLNQFWDDSSTTVAWWAAALVMVSTLSLAYLYIGMRERSKLIGDLRAEDHILKRLFMMIHPLKEVVTLGAVEEVILEMRLSRISFSTKAPVDKAPDQEDRKAGDLTFSSSEAV